MRLFPVRILPILPLLVALSAPAQKADPTLVSKAKSALNVEEARQKAGFCKNLPTTAAINDCNTKEVTRSEDNYLAVARAIGAILRRQSGTPAVEMQPIPFDEAERTWNWYRTQTCQIIGDRHRTTEVTTPAYGACVLAVTGAHVRELGVVYAELLR